MPSNVIEKKERIKKKHTNEQERFEVSAWSRNGSPQNSLIRMILTLGCGGVGDGG